MPPTPAPSGTKTPPPPAKPAARRKMKVEAIADGYYDNKLRRIGDVFFIDGTLPREDQIRKADGSKRDPTLPIMFSPKWMKPADPDAPVHITSSNEVIRRDNAATAATRATGEAGGGSAATEDNPLGADE